MSQPGNSAASRDKAYVLHPYTNLKAHEEVGPMIIREGKGVHVYDEDGKAYIEGMAGLWCTTLGFSEERLITAATEQLRRLPYYHGFAHKSHEPAIDLAEKLIAMAPVPMSRVFFNNSGSEANDTAIKLIWYYNNARGKPEKRKIISRIKGYHGVTVASASLTGLPHLHNDFNLPLDGIMHTDCPHYWRFGKEGESEDAFTDRLAANLEAMIEREGPETVAAFFAEPVMGAGGVIVPPASYFPKIQPILKKHDILLVADEVITGFGRTGNMFGTETYNLQPDIMTMAKALSSAYMPISATLINEEIYKTIRDRSAVHGVFGHGYTYSGHPVACAVALEALKIYQERDIVSHVRKVAPTLQDGLRALAGHPLVGEVRGIGLVAAVEVVQDKATKASFDPKLGIGAHLVRQAQEHGVILRNIGDAVAFSPPLIIEDGEVSQMVEGFRRALDDTANMIEARGLGKVA